MPSRTTILAATPHCDARRVSRIGQNGVHFVCGRPLVYSFRAGVWRCLDCGATRTRMDATRQFVAR